MYRNCILAVDFRMKIKVYLWCFYCAWVMRKLFTYSTERYVKFYLLTCASVRLFNLGFLCFSYHAVGLRDIIISWRFCSWIAWPYDIYWIFCSWTAWHYDILKILCLDCVTLWYNEDFVVGLRDITISWRFCSWTAWPYDIYWRFCSWTA